MAPGASGPVHAYIPASPGCWSLFCSLTDWMHSLVGDYGSTIAQQLVDSYMIQHAINAERRNRQSVAVHLMSLGASLELGVKGDELRVLLGRWTHREYPELLPRPLEYDITVDQIVLAVDSERREVVGDWARSAWQAWTEHHEVVRGWLARSAVGRAWHP
jgi:hypothetical protein